MVVPSNNFFQNMDTRYKSLALRKIYRDAVFSDPSLSEEFRKPIVLKFKDNDKIKDSVINSILTSFNNDFRDFVSVEDQTLLYTEGEYTIVASVHPMVDEFNEDWIFIAMIMPALSDSAVMTESLDSFANTLNNRSGYGLWTNYKSDAGDNTMFAYMSGITIKKSNWSLRTDSFASYSIQQLHAYGSKMLEDDNYSSRTLTKILADNIAYANTAKVELDELSQQGVFDFINRLSPRLQSALTVEPDRQGYKFYLPLREGKVNKSTTVRLTPWVNPILGGGLFVSAELPGILPKNELAKIVKKLNLGDTDDELIIHTTPKLVGSWAADLVGMEDEWVSVSYNAFIPFGEPHNFTLSEQIEGIVKEIYTSWPKFNDQVLFSKLIECQEG